MDTDDRRWMPNSLSMQYVVSASCNCEFWIGGSAAVSSRIFTTQHGRLCRSTETVSSPATVAFFTTAFESSDSSLVGRFATAPAGPSAAAVFVYCFAAWLYIQMNSPFETIVMFAACALVSMRDFPGFIRYTDVSVMTLVGGRTPEFISTVDSRTYCKL